MKCLEKPASRSRSLSSMTIARMGHGKWLTPWSAHTRACGSSGAFMNVDWHTGGHLDAARDARHGSGPYVRLLRTSPVSDREHSSQSGGLKDSPGGFGTWSVPDGRRDPLHLH